MYLVYLDDSHNGEKISIGWAYCFTIVHETCIKNIEEKFLHFRNSLGSSYPNYDWKNIEFHANPIFTGKNEFRKISKKIRGCIYLKYMEFIASLDISLIIGCTNEIDMPFKKFRLLERTISRVGKYIDCQSDKIFMFIADVGNEKEILINKNIMKKIIITIHILFFLLFLQIHKNLILYKYQIWFLILFTEMKTRKKKIFGKMNY